MDPRGTTFSHLAAQLRRMSTPERKGDLPKCQSSWHDPNSGLKYLECWVEGCQKGCSPCHQVSSPQKSHTQIHYEQLLKTFQMSSTQEGACERAEGINPGKELRLEPKRLSRNSSACSMFVTITGTQPSQACWLLLHSRSICGTPGMNETQRRPKISTVKVIS